MTANEIAALLRRNPPVDCLLGVVIHGANATEQTSRWVSLTRAGVVSDTTADDPIEERLVLELSRTFLKEVASSGPFAVIAGAEHGHFVVDGDFRLFLYFMTEVLELIVCVALEEEAAGRLGQVPAQPTPSLVAQESAAFISEHTVTTGALSAAVLTRLVETVGTPSEEGGAGE